MKKKIELNGETLIEKNCNLVVGNLYFLNQPTYFESFDTLQHSSWDLATIYETGSPVVFLDCFYYESIKTAVLNFVVKGQSLWYMYPNNAEIETINVSDIFSPCFC